MPKTHWILVESGPGDWALNMAVDHALLESAPAAGKPVLRFYGWTTPAASFGYFQKYAEVEAMTPLRPLVRRPTGGGLVPHDADWTYSVAVPPGDAWYSLTAVDSYRRIHEWIRAAFQLLGVKTDLADCCRKPAPGQCFEGHEKFDVLWLGRKIAGAAQRRTRSGLLIQGSLQPRPPGCRRDDWEKAMRGAGEACQNVLWEHGELDAQTAARAAELREKIYLRPEYNRRR